MEPLSRVIRVFCLGCGSPYSKPVGRGTVKTNPGCPKCGYLGWTDHGGEVTEESARRRFAVGLPQRHFAQSG